MEEEERAILVTVRARLDPAFEGITFISLRRYDLTDDGEPTDQTEVSSIDDAIDIIRVWLAQPSTRS